MGDASPMGGAAFVVPLSPVRSLEEVVGHWAETKIQPFGGLKHQAAEERQPAAVQL